MWPGPAIPVLLGHAVLDRHDRVAVDQVDPVVDQLGRATGCDPRRPARRTRRPTARWSRGRGPSAISSPGTRPASSIASSSSFTASSLAGRSGANPPSSPTAVDRPRSASTDRRAWYVSVPQRSASLNDAAPTGISMNSWKSMELLGVRTAVEHVEHRHGQDVGVGAADGPVERELEVVRHRLGIGQGHGQHGVGARAGPCPASRPGRSW